MMFPHKRSEEEQEAAPAHSLRQEAEEEVTLPRRRRGEKTGHVISVAMERIAKRPGETEQSCAVLRVPKDPVQRHI